MKKKKKDLTSSYSAKWRVWKLKRMGELSVGKWDRGEDTQIDMIFGSTRKEALKYFRLEVASRKDPRIEKVMLRMFGATKK